MKARVVPVFRFLQPYQLYARPAIYVGPGPQKGGDTSYSFLSDDGIMNLTRDECIRAFDRGWLSVIRDVPVNP